MVPFNRIDVFDSRATLLHVDGDLNYLYTPGELARFPLVQQGIEGVRIRLDRGITDKTRTVNIFLPQFYRQNRIYSLIDSLGAATDLAQLRVLATVTDAETQTIPTLKAEIEALQTTNPVAQLQLAQTLKQHLDALIKSSPPSADSTCSSTPRASCDCEKPNSNMKRRHRNRSRDFQYRDCCRRNGGASSRPEKNI